eukprot:TRINITY_DN60041_c0_g1_i1.p1 TRINITY_DN60041_c0_g1~~TRINITY_DN60041_c0_g1_i1.p1  ORF type:complete len:659 (-),score=47.79 TRINITY_DN60041_c0_g1_i1:1577-3397(-)
MTIGGTTVPTPIYLGLVWEESDAPGEPGSAIRHLAVRQALKQAAAAGTLQIPEKLVQQYAVPPSPVKQHIDGTTLDKMSVSPPLLIPHPDDDPRETVEVISTRSTSSSSAFHNENFVTIDSEGHAGEKEADPLDQEEIAMEADNETYPSYSSDDRRSHHQPGSPSQTDAEEDAASAHQQVNVASPPKPTSEDEDDVAIQEEHRSGAEKKEAVPLSPREIYPEQHGGERPPECPLLPRSSFSNTWYKCNDKIGKGCKAQVWAVEYSSSPDQDESCDAGAELPSGPLIAKVMNPKPHPDSDSDDSDCDDTTVQGVGVYTASVETVNMWRIQGVPEKFKRKFNFATPPAHLKHYIAQWKDECNHSYLVTEYINGYDLHDVIYTHDLSMELEVRMTQFISLVKRMDEIHKGARLAHLDIHPKNVRIDQVHDEALKIIDWSCGRPFGTSYGCCRLEDAERLPQIAPEGFDYDCPWARIVHESSDNYGLRYILSQLFPAEDKGRSASHWLYTIMATAMQQLLVPDHHPHNCSTYPNKHARGESFVAGELPTCSCQAPEQRVSLDKLASKAEEVMAHIEMFLAADPNSQQSPPEVETMLHEIAPDPTYRPTFD